MLLVQAFFCVSHACLEGPVLLPVGQTHSLVDVIPKMNYDTPEYIIDSITPKLNINQQGCKPCSNQFSFFMVSTSPVTKSWCTDLACKIVRRSCAKSAEHTKPFFLPHLQNCLTFLSLQGECDFHYLGSASGV